jgi:hypothetical protein
MFHVLGYHFSPLTGRLNLLPCISFISDDFSVAERICFKLRKTSSYQPDTVLYFTKQLLARGEYSASLTNGGFITVDLRESQANTL